ncbi:deoxyribodipyrimidine photo-lyase [Patescibacteria group bacterium]|nr:deoxyribodipyrimidine photo-lyase [Patescibacteria group bacterium]
MHEDRARSLNSTSARPGPVLYWMDRDMRLKDNWALLHARALAGPSPLLIAYNLVPSFLNGGKRQLAFKRDALKELERDARALGIPFILLVDEKGTNTPKLITACVERYGIGTVVTDFSPLRIQRAWKTEIADTLPCPLIEVDAHNIVPAWVTSPKVEFAAYTIRPKIHTLLPTYCVEFPDLAAPETDMDVPMVDWKLIDARLEGWTDTIRFVPGEKAATEALHTFLNERLPRYGSDRNDALADGQSGLSPYLHYGMLSAQRIALLVVEEVQKPIEMILSKSRNKAKVEEGKTLALIDHAGAFLEELIVRRELSDNFCLYNPAYDSYEGFPDWAKRSFNAHRNDERAYTYSVEQFEKGQTHDPLWNAAQYEMVTSGKMHGYMRMYWAKKILEWTRDPETAMEIAITLNDRYELDGRDPNGYAGIAWSIGGTHDRAWFTRPIFGQVRFMARSGADKKFDTDAYIAKWSPRLL